MRMLTAIVTHVLTGPDQGDGRPGTATVAPMPFPHRPVAIVVGLGVGSDAEPAPRLMLYMTPGEAAALRDAIDELVRQPMKPMKGLPS